MKMKKNNIGHSICKNRAAFFLFFYVLIFSCSANSAKEKFYDSIKSKIKVHDFDGAIKKLQSAPKYKNDFLYNFYYGGACIMKDTATLARTASEYFLKAYEINPNDYSNLLLLTSSLLTIHDNERAEKYALKAAEIWEGDGGAVADATKEPYGLLASAYYDMVDLQRAQAALKKSLQINPNNEQLVLLEKIVSAKLNQNTEFFLIFEEMQNTADDYLFTKYGKALIELKEFKKARDFFNAKINAVEKDSYISSVCFLQLAYLELFDGNLAAAKNCFDAAENQKTQIDDYNKYMSFYYFLLNDATKANNHFKLYRFKREQLNSVVFEEVSGFTEMEEYFFDDFYFMNLKLNRKQ